MTYFSDFKNITYDLTNRGDVEPQLITITDLTARIALRISENSLNEITDKYIIADGETPEIISYKVYGTPYYHWTILYVNNITDIHSQWPLNATALNEFTKRKYTNINATKYFVKTPEHIAMDKNFIIEHYGIDSVLEITNSLYEEEKNDLKRFIKVLKPSYIKSFVDQFKLRMKVNG